MVEINNLDFEKGRYYENETRDARMHLVLGSVCTTLAIPFFILSVYSFKERFYIMIGLLLFGIASLYLGHSKREETKKWLR